MLNLNRYRTLLFAGVAIALLCFISVCPRPSLAAVAPSQQPQTTVYIHLGSMEGGMVYEPNHLNFVAGQAYKLILDNPSPIKHYFTAKDFADAIWTLKVQAGPVEIKGAIHEMELQPKAEAEWVFIPQKPGTFALHCPIAGHTEAGMVGELTIEAP